MVTRALVAEGARVVAGARSDDSLKDIDRVTGVAVDLASPDGPARLVQRALDDHGRLRTMTVTGGPGIADISADLQDHSARVRAVQVGLEDGRSAARAVKALLG